jgi:enamine deaminase RidA (YjgF/YER057c/UK114 family)
MSSAKSVEERLEAMGLTLPPAVKPVASYVPTVRTGNLVYTSGQLPIESGQLRWQGKVDTDVDVGQAYEAARLSALNALAAIKDEIGDLDRITRVVRVCVYVNSAPGFTRQPTVANGASDLLQELFGDCGKHTRSAIGVAELPLNAPVEIELLVAVAE